MAHFRVVDRGASVTSPLYILDGMIAFDHIAIALPRLADAPAALVGQLGGTPAYGMPADSYRFFHWRFAGGGRIEALEPTGVDGFLSRFLARHGPGIHHVTFKVPDLAEACARARAHGYDIVGLSTAKPDWQEAFLHPRQALGIVVQLAQSSGALPAPQLSPPAGPASPPPAVTLLGLRMRARSLERARRQWEAVLRGEVRRISAREVTFGWPDSPLRLWVEADPGAEEGPVSIEYASDRAAVPDGPHPVLGATFLRRRPDDAVPDA